MAIKTEGSNINGMIYRYWPALQTANLPTSDSLILWLKLDHTKMTILPIEQTDLHMQDTHRYCWTENHSKSCNRIIYFIFINSFRRNLPSAGDDEEVGEVFLFPSNLANWFLFFRFVS